MMSWAGNPSVVSPAKSRSNELLARIRGRLRYTSPTGAPTGLVSPNVDGQRIPISNKGNKEVNPAHKAMDRSGGKRRAPFSPTSGSRNALQKPRPDGSLIA